MYNIYHVYTNVLAALPPLPRRRLWRLGGRRHAPLAPSPRPPPVAAGARPAVELKSARLAFTLPFPPSFPHSFPLDSRTRPCAAAGRRGPDPVSPSPDLGVPGVDLGPCGGVGRGRPSLVGARGLRPACGRWCPPPPRRRGGAAGACGRGHWWRRRRGLRFRLVASRARPLVPSGPSPSWTS